NRNAQIAVFEAQKADADKRAAQAAAIRAEAMPKLGEEEIRLVARLRELPIEAQRLHNTVRRSRRRGPTRRSKCCESLRPNRRMPSAVNASKAMANSANNRDQASICLTRACENPRPHLTIAPVKSPRYNSPVFRQVI